MDAGSYCEDEISAEYYGGILASSRSEDSKDDRGVPLIDLLKSLSTYQIRTHYIFYSLIRRVYLDSPHEINISSDRMGVFIPNIVYKNAMNIPPDDNKGIIASHSIIGLFQKGLISEKYFSGNVEYLKSRILSKQLQDLITCPGIIFFPTHIGIYLFLWANGISNQRERFITSRNFDFKPLKDVIITDYPRTQPIYQSEE
jgi:hypothetical protein